MSQQENHPGITPAIERWRSQIASRPGKRIGSTLFISEPQEVQAFDGVTTQYVLVDEGDEHGLKPGVYVQTNVKPEYYRESFDLRCAIRSQTTLDLMDDKKRSPTTTGEPELDLLNAISYQQFGTTSAGALVLKLSPAFPSQVDNALNGLSNGSTKAKLTPKQ